VNDQQRLDFLIALGQRKNVRKGTARLQCGDKMIEMKVGDFINIPAFKKHRV
jgi:hypothetical protein